ncbi:hypothetical protein OSB04_006751 [Centaurea solstitialis]|uniref:Reverse transcriptase domain-containing protein n=1 Tax=Centaurea solstitialis TaxID=347529 RepID=A0AA38WSV6_9ASTR|nr:hypothetical protein OSB04_006751 [Centaurea solstitialis]
MNPINKREDLAMGSDSKAPVLFKDEYELWVARFRLFIKRKDKGNLILKSIDYGAKPLPMHTVNGMRVVKEVEEMDEAEKTQYLIDLEAQNCLIQAIPNDIYRKLDSYDDSAKSIWDQLEKIMLGSKVGNQLRITTLMDKYENFKMKDGESLEDAYDRFVILMNDMKKNRIPRSEMDFSVKFINNLSLEWKPFTRFVKQHKALNELKVYEVYENLKLFEEEVEEAVLEKQKKEKAEQESLALLTERKKGKSVIKKGKAKVFEVDDYEDEEESEDEERDLMFQSLLTLTEAYRKKYYNKPSSNNRRFASRAVVGYFLGSRVPFPIVQRSLRSAWGKYGFNDVMMNNNGFFFIKFNDEGGSNHAIEEGMLMIRNVPMFITPWDPSKGLARPSHASCPLWVKFHNIPLVLFNSEGISRVASAIGVPKRMDACTASMCDNKWGRPGFAKVLVDVWATGELRKELEVIIPHLHDDGTDKIKIGVEYLWEPLQCSHCCVFGHKRSACAKAVRVVPTQKKVVIDDEGFVRVERKQWRRKETITDDTRKRDVGASTSGTKDNYVGNLESSHLDTHVEHENAFAVLDDVSVELPPVQEKDTREEEISVDTVKELERKRLGLEFTMPEPPVATVVADGSPPIAPQSIVAPKAPIKGRQGSPSFSYLMFNLSCWNIRGLNAPEKQQEVKSLIRNNNLHLCAILETHVRAEVLPTVCSSAFGRWDWIANHSQSECGTRIVIAWDVSCVELMPLEFHRQFIHCQVRIRSTNQAFFVSFIYGDNRGSNRKLLWSGLRKFRAILGNKPWIVAGDFNCLLFPHDALGGISRRNSDMDDFSLCLEDIEVYDVRFMGIHYTWCQKPQTDSGLKRKLDRILANTEFTSAFADSSVRFLPRGLSDHSPGVLGFKGDVRVRKCGFKFDNFLVNDPQFLDTVKRHWDVEIEGTFMYRVTSKLKSLKAPLRKLRSAYGNLSAMSASLKEELDIAQLAADLDPGNVELEVDVMHIRDAYQKSCWADFSATRQRAKVRWLSEGDANTRFFHKVLQERQHSKHLHSICNLDGVYVFDDHVPLAFIDHFISIIGTTDTSVIPSLPEDLFTRHLSIAQANHMIRRVQDDEIKDALFSIGNDKAPGSDGFSSKFFKAAWNIVGPDVLLAIHNFFYRGKLAKELNHTLLCLLPKIPNATVVSDFRPIACCSVLYKCISKVIVNRMKPYLDHLINRAQSAFIPGRKIGDNILMAHELVAGYQLDKGPPRCAFKIDLRKAYDMVSWEFLFTMLRGLRFHPVLVSWITEMVSTPTFSVVVNGEARGFFHGKRGIRQGDPLSPYLFTIVMEGFSMLFKQCVDEAVGFGYHHGCAELDITHLCFADDLFVFTRGDVASVEILKKALSLFASCSGLVPNLEKSDVFFGNVPMDVRAAILTCLPFRSGTFPIRYLGLPLSPVSLKTADYGVLITKVKHRLQNWKTKFLSFGGRKQLIVSVLQSLQLYWMAIFMLPSGIVHDIERLFRDFLWAQGDPSRGRCKVAWSMVCRPVECGGLGFRRLGIWNRALIAKNLWAIITGRECLWVAWARSYSLHNAQFWTARKTSRWSWLFTKMMSIRSDCRRFITVAIGDGMSTNAWEENWLTCGKLSEFMPYRFVHSSGFLASTTVRQLLDTFHDGWPDSWVTRFSVLANVPLPISQHDVRDRFCWDVNEYANGEFTVQRAYKSFVGHFPSVPWWRSVWFKAHIPKHSFCLWTACLERLPTQDRIATWKDEPPDLKCSLCGINNDSHDHLFFECTFSRQVWLQVMDKVHWVGFPCSWHGIVQALSDTGSAPKCLEHQLALAASVYNVWCERNRRLFGGGSKPVPHVVQTILGNVLDRLAWKNKKKHLPSHVDT